MSRLYFALVFFVISNITSSCWCGSNEPYEVWRINSLKSEVLVWSVSEEKLRVAGNEILNEDSKYLIKVEITDQSLIEERISARSFGFINPSYACSPNEDFFRNNIESVLITASEKIYLNDQEYESNFLISNLAIFEDGFFVCNDLERCLVYDGGNPSPKMHRSGKAFVFNILPDSTYRGKFVLYVNLQDGSAYQLETQEVELIRS
jgi:hypothetical protein